MSEIKDNLIESWWSTYRKEVVPANASETQIKETRQAFFGGTYMLYTTLMENVGNDPESQPRDMAMLASIDRELAKFERDFRERHLKKTY